MTTALDTMTAHHAALPTGLPTDPAAEHLTAREEVGAWPTEHAARMTAAYGLHPAGGPACPRVVAGGQHFRPRPDASSSRRCCSRGDGWPWSTSTTVMDHTRVWQDDHGRLVLTTEPYDGAGAADLAAVRAGLASLGLVVELMPWSPWSPGWTSLYAVTRADGATHGTAAPLVLS